MKAYIDRRSRPLGQSIKLSSHRSTARPRCVAFPQRLQNLGAGL